MDVTFSLKLGVVCEKCIPVLTAMHNFNHFRLTCEDFQRY